MPEPTKRVLDIKINGQRYAEAESGTGKLSVVWTDADGNSIVATVRPTTAEFALLPTRDFIEKFVTPIISAMQSGR